ncbi:MAG: long-chain fatty acid--CoA ligase [Bryobacteraceae bacterium]|jgi:long-chain acyl-CoA synthetase
MQPNTSVTTLNDLFFYHLDRYRFDRLLSFQNRGELMVWSTEQFSRSVFALRRFLLESGLAPGDRVAVFSENRPEWHIADFALLLSRLVVVPIYNTLSPSQIAYQLRHSGCRAAIIAGAPQWEILRPLLAGSTPALTALETIVSMEETPGVNSSLPRIVAGAPPFDEPAVRRIRAESLAAAPHDLATIVYTSGTTGTPKGVMLSHSNIVSDLRGSLARVPSNTAHQALSVLPLPHVLERTLSYGYFHEGVRIAYGDPHDLKELMPIHRPDIMGVVPRILEKVKEAVEAQIAQLVPHRRAIAGKLIAAAVARARARMLGGPAESLPHRLLAPLANVLVFPKVHRQLYGLQYFISGGAWLNPDVELFFRAAGFDVLQGYGMTETSPVITLNEYRREKIGSVGPALPGMEVRIGEDGEILTRGPHLMLGYYKDEAATRDILDADGWLRTGDLGSIDADGYVTITGRRKEILVLSNGKNVACAPLEHALQRSPYIQQALIVGDGRKFVCALIVAHPENLARVAAQHGLASSSYDELLLAPPVVALFREELESLQAEFSSFEQAKRFCFLNEEALLDTELMTPTLKVRRSVLERKYAEWIRQMYHQEDPLVIPRPEQAVPAGSYKP